MFLLGPFVFPDEYFPTSSMAWPGALSRPLVLEGSEWCRQVTPFRLECLSLQGLEGPGGDVAVVVCWGLPFCEVFH